MDELKLPAEVKLKLLQAERDSAPDYPDWARGRRAMAPALLPGAILGVLAVGFLRTSLTGIVCGALVGGVLTALTACLFVACRPRRNKKG